MSNPLLDNPYTLPLFSQIKPEHVQPAIKQVLDDSRQKIAELLESLESPTWESLVRPLEDLEDKLGKAWSPVSHLNGVLNSDELRDAYTSCLPMLSEYMTELGQNERLYQAYVALRDSPETFDALSQAQRKIVENALRDFRLSGVALPPEQQQRFKQIALELAQLTSRFSDNVLDATNAWSKHITNESLLAGLPPSALELGRQTAATRNLTGWVFSLEFPSYFAIITHADNRDLRREFYEAYVTRASDRGPQAGQYDNTELMEKILALRHEEAQLLGYSNFAELSLATKMAKSPDQVIGFLNDLAARSLPVARADFTELETFARDKYRILVLQAWDLAYFSEKLRQQKYAFSEEDVKAYFPLPRVLDGLFALIERLYGCRVAERHGVDVWHPDVKFFDLFNPDGSLRGSFYLDLYARPKKRGGAWMDDCVTRRVVDAVLQTPVAYLTCNFAPPTEGRPSLLRHEEVLTLFHEFGHGLHHILTRIDYLGVSGIHGVQWDAVELPSQFMENFCWEREVLGLMSGHYQTGAPLPDALFEKMIAAKNFQAGMQMLRQLEFALFDFRIHREYDPEQGGRIYAILDEVRRAVAVFYPPAYNRFPHSFGHIFAGGYAAGYYSYKWAEVLSSDAFSLFEERGVTDRETGQQFLTTVLEQGGSRDAMELFVEFRGREPTVDALLRHSGIAA